MSTINQPTTNMYTVNIEDTGGHPDSDISILRECVISCLKPDPASSKDLSERLARELSKSEVMGRSFRFVWVGQSIELNAFNWRWRDFFIIFLDRNVMPGRSDHVYFWAERRPEKVSLQEKCLDVISESMKSDEKEEIKGLGLPRCLEDRLKEMMANLMRRRRLRTASMLQDSLCEITSLR